VYGNVGGGVFTLLGDTIIFRLKRLLLRKPCTSPLSSTTAFPPRDYFVRVRVPLEGKKGKGRRYHRRASLAYTAVRARLTLVVVNCGNLERPVALARASAVFISFLSPRTLSLHSVARARPPVCLPTSQPGCPPALVMYARI